MLLFVKTPLQPPLALTVPSQVAKAEFTAACVWHAAVVVFAGQVSTTGGGAANTCIVRLQEAERPQASVTVHVRVTL